MWLGWANKIPGTVKIQTISELTNWEEKWQRLVENIYVNEDTLKVILESQDSYENILNLVEKELQEKRNDFIKNQWYEVKTIVFKKTWTQEKVTIEADKVREHINDTKASSKHILMWESYLASPDNTQRITNPTNIETTNTPPWTIDFD